jgi:ketopantoate reductase
MDVVVFGAGSLGSLVGGLLAGGHDVTLVGPDPHVSAVRERGLRLVGAVEMTVRPDAVTDPPAAADLAGVCVKAPTPRRPARSAASPTPRASTCRPTRPRRPSNGWRRRRRRTPPPCGRTSRPAAGPRPTPSGGYVWERADEHGVDVPVNTTMTRLLRAWEAERGLR